MTIKFWPLCSVAYVPGIQTITGLDGEVWTVGGQVDFGPFPDVTLLDKYAPNATSAGDQGLLAHELTHVRQFWRLLALCAVAFSLMAYGGAVLAHQSPWLAAFAVVPALFVHPVLYNNVRAYRLRAELEAYAEQTRFPDRDGHPLALEEMAHALMSPKYDFGLSEAEAFQATKDYLA